MKKNIFPVLLFIFSVSGAVSVFAAKSSPDPNVMSKAYWGIWNDDVQKEIDSRIEKHRKADAQF